MKMLIGGKKVDASDGATIEVYNPATMQVIDTIPVATEEDVALAVAHACEGFKTWSKTPLYKRIEILKTFHRKLQEHSEELARLMSAEVGKTITLARDCLNWSAAMVEGFLEHARVMGTEVIPVSNRMTTEGAMIVTVREPLGVIAGILPFNYPIDQITHKCIPALVMGNAVVLKPATETPLADLCYVELLLESGVPGDVVQMVTGSGGKIGKWLVGDPRIAMVSLTGSTEVGIETATTAAQHLHHVALELGGNDPFVILPDADIDFAVDESIAGRISNAGQTCCACKRFLVPNDKKTAYLEKLIAGLKEVKVGDPSKEETECGPVVSRRAAVDIEKQIAHTVKQGGKLLYGGKRYQETFIEPTVLEVTTACDVAHDMEIFGPVFTVIGYDSIEEAIAIANDTKYGLSSGICGSDMKTILKVASSLQAGSCIINGNGNKRTADQTFGGYKMSGLGREGGHYTLEEFSQVKALHLNQLVF